MFGFTTIKAVVIETFQG